MTYQRRSTRTKGMIFGWNSQANVTGSGVARYCPLTGISSVYATRTEQELVMPIAGTFRRMSARVTAVSGAGKNRNVVLCVNGVNQALGGTFSGAVQTTVTDFVNQIHVNIGDLVCTYVDDDGAATTGLMVVYEFVPD